MTADEPLMFLGEEVDRNSHTQCDVIRAWLVRKIRTVAVRDFAYMAFGHDPDGRCVAWAVIAPDRVPMLHYGPGECVEWHLIPVEEAISWAKTERAR